MQRSRRYFIKYPLNHYNNSIWKTIKGKEFVISLEEASKYVFILNQMPTDVNRVDNISILGTGQPHIILLRQ